VLVFDKGVITAIGGAGTSFNRATTEVINVPGRHIYPGLIAMGTSVGLQEVASVRATLDYQEVGSLNSNVRALIAYNTDSEIIPTLRNTGVLLTQAVPQGGLISGRSSVFNADGWNWEDAVLRKDDGLWVNWPAFLTRSFNEEDFSITTKRNDRRQPVIQELRQHLTEAKAYLEIKNPSPVNLRLEAMRSLFDGTTNLYLRANLAKDMVEAVQFGQELGIRKLVIVGGDEAYKVAGFLKENNVPVVLDPLHRLPTRPDDDVYLPYEQPGRLLKAGVQVALSYSDEWWRTRNLAFLAGTAAGFGGLSKEEALQMITLTPARIMGIDKQVGSLEKGKLATLVVSRGDILEMRSNVVEQVYIKGATVNLDDKHKRLYQKYKEKYGQDTTGK
jgi:hypothetical protein